MGHAGLPGYENSVSLRTGFNPDFYKIPGPATLDRYAQRNENFVLV